MRALALCVALALVSACGKKATPEATAQQAPATALGETVHFDDSDWTVLDAKDVGRKVTSNLDPTDTKTTSGRFVEVHFKVTNKGPKNEIVRDPPKVVDDKGREFQPLELQSFYVPKGARTTTMEVLQPNVEREFTSVLDVAADAKGLKLALHRLAPLGETRMVALGL